VTRIAEKTSWYIGRIAPAQPPEKPCFDSNVEVGFFFFWPHV
jgi:hypothetical protein